MSEEAFWAALDAAVPRDRGDYPFVFAGIRRKGARTQRERIEEVVAMTLGRRLRRPLRRTLPRRRASSRALDEALDRGHEVDRAQARFFLDSALCTTLAYGEEWVESNRARHVADTFVACFGPEATFWTNYPQLTLSLVETGVVAVDSTAAGILWIVDED